MNSHQETKTYIRWSNQTNTRNDKNLWHYIRKTCVIDTGWCPFGISRGEMNPSTLSLLFGVYDSWVLFRVSVGPETCSTHCLSKVINGSFGFTNIVTTNWPAWVPPLETKDVSDYWGQTIPNNTWAPQKGYCKKAKTQNNLIFLLSWLNCDTLMSFNKDQSCFAACLIRAPQTHLWHWSKHAWQG